MELEAEGWVKRDTHCAKFSLRLTPAESISKPARVRTGEHQCFVCCGESVEHLIIPSYGVTNSISSEPSATNISALGMVVVWCCVI